MSAVSFLSMSFRPVVGVGLCVALAGCGGSGGSGNQAAGNGIDPLVAAVTLAGKPSIALTDGDFEIGTEDIPELLFRKPDLDLGVNEGSAMRVTSIDEGQDGEYYLISGYSGGTNAVVLASHSADTLQLGGAVFRTGPFVSNPLEVKPVYEGDYLGAIVTNNGIPARASDSLRFLVTGDARIAVNFDDKSLAGEITNRALYAFGDLDSPAANTKTTDLTLQRAKFDEEGLFQGDVIGGELTVGDEVYTRTSGEYRGSLGDQGPVTSAGLVTIVNDIPNPPFRNQRVELGAFTTGGNN